MIFFDNLRKFFFIGMIFRDFYILLNEELVLNCIVNVFFYYDFVSLYFIYKFNMFVLERELFKEYIIIVNNIIIFLRKMVRLLEEVGIYFCKIRDVRFGVVDR